MLIKFRCISRIGHIGFLRGSSRARADPLTFPYHLSIGQIGDSYLTGGVLRIYLGMQWQINQ